MWNSVPVPGDWVQTRTKTSTGFLGDMTTGGVSAGSKAVVLSRSGRWITIEFGSGLTARTKAANCRVVHRQGGYERFRNRARRVAIARCALLVFLLWPMAQFVVLYLWHNHSFNGITQSLAISSVDSGVELLNTLIARPIQTFAYLAFLAVLGKLAVPR